MLCVVAYARKDRVMLAQVKSMLVVGCALVCMAGCAAHTADRRPPPGKASESMTSDPHPQLPAGISSVQRGWVVVVASSRALWWNGRRFGLLYHGRFYPRSASHGASSQLSRSALTRWFRARLSTIPVASWRLRLVVSDRVSSIVVQRLLRAAGSVGLGRFRLITFHES